MSNLKQVNGKQVPAYLQVRNRYPLLEDKSYFGKLQHLLGTYLPAKKILTSTHLCMKIPPTTLTIKLYPNGKW